METPSFAAAASIFLGSTGSTAAVVPSFAIRLHAQATILVDQSDTGYAITILHTKG